MLLSQALSEQSGAADKAGDKDQADQLSQQAAAQMTQCLADATQALATAGDLKPELLVLEHYFTVRDYGRLTTLSQRLISQYASPTKPWAAGQLFLGIARIGMKPQDLKGAGEALDTLLAAGVIDDNLIDHLPTQAAYWRTAVAQMQGDTTKTLECVRKIRDEMPKGPIRSDALARFGNVAGLSRVN
jgi:hypothetical protein